MVAADPLGPGIEPIPENLFRDPIGYIRADHDRQRAILHLLDELVDLIEPELSLSDAWKGSLKQAADYLATGYPLHRQDEENDLFPALRQHAGTLGENGRLLRRIMREHHDGSGLLDQVVADLRAFAGGGPVRGALDLLRTQLRFIETMRCRLAMVDEVLLPLALHLLADTERERIGRSMAARRNAAYPEPRTP